MEKCDCCYDFLVPNKMSGDFFEGDALLNKAITENATRSTDEIHEYIPSLTKIDPIARVEFDPLERIYETLTTST